MTDDLEPGRTRTMWPMYALIAAMFALGVAFAYVFVWSRFDRGRVPGPYSFLVAAAPFAVAAAAFRAVREQVREDAGRWSERRARLRAAKREKLAPYRVEPAGRIVDEGPFRSAPTPAPMVARPLAPTPAPAPVVVVSADDDRAGPKLLT